jgi:DNA-directed RNA polymerase II subunit RPB11
MNKPEPFELFDLEGDIKIKEEPVQKMPDTSTFDINKEDHTIGNIIRTELLEDRSVKFAGYKIPHPLEHRIEVKVQTTGECTPRAALLNTVNNLIFKYETLKNLFKEEYDKLDNQRSTQERQDW